MQLVGGIVRVTLNRGTNHHVAIGWTGEVLEGNTANVLAYFKIHKVRARYSIGNVDLPFSTIQANTRVRLYAP